MTRGQTAVAKAVVAAGVMGVALALPPPTAAGPCSDQFYQQAGDCSQGLGSCLSGSGWWASAGCYVTGEVCDEATAAIYAACLVFGHS